MAGHLVPYTVHGKIAPFGGNRAIVGMDTYLSRPSADSYYVWGYKHRAVLFDGWMEALGAAMAATGPLWRMPDPETVVVEAI